MSISCTNWSWSCTSHDGHTFPKRALLIHGPDCLAGPCMNISEGIQHCSEDGGLSVWICRGYGHWTAGHYTIVALNSRVGESMCLLGQWLIVWLPSVSGRYAMELRGVLQTMQRSYRASALTRRDAICQRPRKCLLERINTLKYSFILFVCFHACIKLIYSLHIHVFCYFFIMVAIMAD